MKLWCLQGVALRLTACGAYALSLLCSMPVAAQITPDGSVGTTVTPNVEIKGVGSEVIDGGTIRGANLFHSFREFNILSGRGAYFTNPEGITNIFSRITGNNPSHINGILGVLGNANLFLLNPNGIIFGAHARLDLNGSFIGTTANSIRFADGVEFSAQNPSASPLLTVSVPIGLQMGQNPAPIQVNGNGHSLSGGLLSAVTGSRGPTELRTQPGRTLALVGGEITLNGGVLSGEAGLIHLGAVGQQNTNMMVSLVPTDTGWDFNYAGIDSFAPIRLSQKALIDASGPQTGSIELTGSQIDIANGSWVFIENREDRTAGNIHINATESLVVGGRSIDQKTDSRIFNYNSGTGQGGDIQVLTRQLSVLDAANISTLTAGSGNGGNITIAAVESIVMEDASSTAPLVSTTYIVADTRASGNAGDITISTQQLTLLPGSVISSRTAFSNGKGGEITLNVSDFIDLIGITSRGVGEATVSSVSFGAGAAGQLKINTPRLRLLEGGGILAINVGSGRGGEVLLNVSETLEIRGQHTRFDIGVTPSRIAASTDIPSGAAQRLFGLPPIASGASGSIEINTPNLILDDTAEIRVRNQGSGNGGTLLVSADRISLNDRAQILATTNSGEGGNITLQSQDLQLRNNSTISATAGGTGNGGNIRIDSPTIAGLENSDIIANAFQGNGGNIQINTQSIFGLANRPQLTPGSDISASSQFGLSGTVTITNPEVETRSFLVELPQNLLDTREQITTGCAADRGNTFSITGRGGLPENPSSALLGRAVWWDNRDLSQVNQTAQKLPLTETTPEIVEATGFRINAQGQVELVADAASGSNSWQSPTNCQTLPLSSSGLRNLPRHLISCSFDYP